MDSTGKCPLLRSQSKIYMEGNLATSAVFDFTLIYPAVQCRNTGYCAPLAMGCWKIRMHVAFLPCDISSQHICSGQHLQGSWSYFSESLFHPNVPWTTLGILLCIIRLTCGNSSLKVNFLLNKCSYNHRQNLRNNVEGKNRVWLSVSLGHLHCKNVSPIQTKCHCSSLNKMTSSSSAEAAEHFHEE